MGAMLQSRVKLPVSWVIMNSWLVVVVAVVVIAVVVVVVVVVVIAPLQARPVSR